MASIADISLKYKNFILEIPIVRNITHFQFTCFINISSFRNVNSIEILAFIIYKHSLKKYVLDLSSCQPKILYLYLFISSCFHSY